MEIQIIGRDLSLEAEQSARAYLRRLKEENSKPVDGELTKTDDDLKAISLAQKHLGGKLAELGITTPPFLEPDRIHIVPDEVYNRYTNADSAAFYNSYRQDVIVKRGGGNSPIKLYKILVHEGGHETSLHVFKVSSTSGIMEGLNECRFGYLITQPQDPFHRHFSLFDEAVVEKMAIDIFKVNQLELMSALGYRPSDYQSMYSYTEWVEILNIIIEKVAGSTNSQPDQVWRSILLGLFRPSLAHLRSVDQTFGAGSVRFLAAIDQGFKAMTNYSAKQLSLRYFKTDSETKRVQIALSALHERERMKYLIARGELKRIN